MDRPSLRTIGPYDLLEPIGRGGMGVVYRGRHRDLQADRAVKLLPPHLAADDSFVVRFKREATIAAGLRHPNIVLIYDVGQEGDYHYIVMELVAGRSLRDVIRADQPLSIARIVRLLGPLADALDFAHTNGVVHRDVKPSNVIVGRDDKVTLLDFGIARAMEGAQQLTRAGLIVGTPEYMAPEVVTGGRPGANADLYALGVVAYEMLTGHVPFHGVNTTAVAYAQVHSPPPSPRADRVDLPEAMERVLLRQLAKNPAMRYPDARSFVRALERGAFEDAQAAARDESGGVGERDRTRETWVGTGHAAVRPLPQPRAETVLSPRQEPPRSRAERPTMEVPGAPGGTGASGGRSWLAMLVAALLLVILGGYGLLAWGERQGAPGPQPTIQAPASKPGAPGTKNEAANAVPDVAPDGAVARAPAPPPTGAAPAATEPAPTVASTTASLDEARAAIGAGDFALAIGLLAALKQRDPTVAGLEDLLFEAQLGQGQALLPSDPDASAAAFGEALTLRPNDQQALAGQRRATVARLKKRADASQGQDDEATIEALEQALQIEPNEGDIRGRLYGLLIAKADRLLPTDAGQARATLVHATEIDPARMEARDRLARFAIAPSTTEQVQEVARWGKGTVDRLAYSPDGRLLAVASSSGVYLYEVATRAEVRYLETGLFVWDAAFSPDGQEIAGAVDDGSIRIWSVADGALQRTLTGHAGPVTGVAYSPDGQWLLSGSVDRTARLWRRDDGSPVRTMQGHEDEVRAVAFSADSQRAATASADRTARVWGVADGALQATLRGHEDPLTGIAFSQDGQWVATSAKDKTARLWRASDGGLVRTLTGHTGWVLDVAFSADGQTVVTAAADNTAKLWQVTDGTNVQTLEGHAGWVVAAAVSGDRQTGEQQTVATGSRDGTIRFWRLATGEPSGAIEGQSSLVRGVAISPDGRTIAASMENGSIHLLHSSDGSPMQTLSGHTDAVYGVAFSPDGQLLASASDDRTIRLWRVADGSLVRTLTGHTDWVRAVRFGEAGRTLFSGSADKTVRAWRVEDGALTRTIQGHAWGVTSLAVSPDGGVLATGTADTPIRLFNPADQVPPRVLNGHTDWVNGLAISSNGQTLASASSDRTVRLWRLSDDSAIRTLQGHTDVVTSVAFTEDGQIVASSGWDGTVRLWRSGDGGLARTLQGHTRDVNGVAVSPDGQVLVSGSSDGTVRVWGVR